MAAEQDRSLTKSDIELLMETYQNMFIMHKTVLDQQLSMNECLKNILENQKGIGINYIELLKIIGKIEMISNITDDGNKDITKVVDAINSGVKSHNDEFLKFSGAITNKVYIAWIGSASIIMGLIAIFFK